VETKATGKYQIRGKVHDLDCLARESLMKAFKIRYTMQKKQHGILSNRFI